MNQQELLATIKKLEQEKKVLLDTIDNFNTQLKEIEEFKQKLYSTESALENSIDALFFILHIIKELSLKPMDIFTHQQINKMLNVVYNVLEGVEIEKIASESEIEDGVSVYDNIKKQIENSRQNNFTNTFKINNPRFIQ